MQVTALVILPPKPPPVYSLTTTMLSVIDAQPAPDGGNGLRGALGGAVDDRPCRSASTPWRCGFPESGGWCWESRRFRRGRVGLLHPLFDVTDLHLGVADLTHGQLALVILGEIGLGPLDFARAEGGGAGVPGATSGRSQTLPPTRALGPPGRRLASGSTAWGKRWISSLIFSMASAAVSSSTAQTARIGSP